MTQISVSPLSLTQASLPIGGPGNAAGGAETLDFSQVLDGANPPVPGSQPGLAAPAGNLVPAASSLPGGNGGKLPGKNLPGGIEAPSDDPSLIAAPVGTVLDPASVPIALAMVLPSSPLPPSAAPIPSRVQTAASPLSSAPLAQAAAQPGSAPRPGTSSPADASIMARLALSAPVVTAAPAVTASPAEPAAPATLAASAAHGTSADLAARGLSLGPVTMSPATMKPAGTAAALVANVADPAAIAAKAPVGAAAAIPDGTPASTPDGAAPTASPVAAATADRPASTEPMRMPAAMSAPSLAEGQAPVAAQPEAQAGGQDRPADQRSRGTPAPAAARLEGEDRRSSAVSGTTLPAATVAAAPVIAGTTPAAPVTTAAAPAVAAPPSAERPQDFATLVGRLAEAREAAAPQVVRTSLHHAELGTIALQFRHEGTGLAVTMSSADADLAASVQAALVAAPGAGSASGDAARQGAGQGQNGFGQGGASGNPRQAGGDARSAIAGQNGGSLSGLTWGSGQGGSQQNGQGGQPSAPARLQAEGRGQPASARDVAPASAPASGERGSGIYA